MKINTKQVLLASLAVLVVIGGLVFYNNQAYAEPEQVELSGYLWSSNIGWISLQGNSYGVTATRDSDNSYTLDGFGWSKNIGWIKFNPGGSYPTGGGTLAQDAFIEDDGNITGWIRACSVFESGCSGNLKSDTQRGGWDGWISLSGTNYGAEFLGTGVSDHGGNFDGFSWGYLVTGWVDWSWAKWGGANPNQSCSPANGSTVQTGSSVRATAPGDWVSYVWEAAGINLGEGVDCRDFGTCSGSVINESGSVSLTVTDAGGSGQSFTCTWNVGTNNSVAVTLRAVDQANGSLIGASGPQFVVNNSANTVFVAQTNSGGVVTLTPNTTYVFNPPAITGYEFVSWDKSCTPFSPEYPTVCQYGISAPTTMTARYQRTLSDDFSIDFPDCQNPEKLNGISSYDDCENADNVCVVTANRDADGKAESGTVSFRTNDYPANSAAGGNPASVTLLKAYSLPYAGATYGGPVVRVGSTDHSQSGAAREANIGTSYGIGIGAPVSLRFENPGGLNNVSSIYAGLNIIKLKFSRGAVVNNYCVGVRYIDDIVAPQ